MTPRTKRRPFADAIVAMVPAATLTSYHDRGWYSATFAGLQVTLQLRIGGPGADVAADHLARSLPEHIFELPCYIVADALVVHSKSLECGDHLVTIEALLLED